MYMLRAPSNFITLERTGGDKNGEHSRSAIYEYISKFFLFFVVVPVGIMALGHIIYIIVESINEIRKK